MVSDGRSATPQSAGGPHHKTLIAYNIRPYRAQGDGADTWAGMSTNRRQDYRHRFEPDGQLPAEVLSAQRHEPLAGEIVNLSVSGMLVRVDYLTIPFTPDEQLIVSVKSPEDNFHLTVRTELVHKRVQDGSRYYGLRFLRPISPAASASRDDQVWRFLLEQQRRTLRRREGQPAVRAPR